MTAKEKLIKMRELYPNCPPDRMTAEDDPPGTVENDEDDNLSMFIRDEDADVPVLNTPTDSDRPPVPRNDVNGLPVLETPKMNFEKKSRKDRTNDDPPGTVPNTQDGDLSMFVPDEDDPVFAAEEELENVATDVPILNAPGDSE